MRRLIFLIATTVLMCIISCQKMETISLDSQTDRMSLETKAGNPACLSDRFAVSLSDAKHYSELYKQGEDGTGDGWYTCSSNWYCYSYNCYFSPSNSIKYCCPYYQ